MFEDLNSLGNESIESLHDLPFHCPKTWGIVILAMIIMLVIINVFVTLVEKILSSFNPTVADTKTHTTHKAIPVINVIPPTPMSQKTKWISIRRNPRQLAHHGIPNFNVISLTPIKVNQDTPTRYNSLPNINIIPPTPIKVEQGLTSRTASLPNINVIPPTPTKENQLALPTTPLKRTPPMAAIYESGLDAEEMSPDLPRLQLSPDELIRSPDMDETDGNDTTGDSDISTTGRNRSLRSSNQPRLSRRNRRQTEFFKY